MESLLKGRLHSPAQPSLISSCLTSLVKKLQGFQLVSMDWNLLSLLAQNVLYLGLVLVGQLAHGLCKGHNPDYDGGSNHHCLHEAELQYGQEAGHQLEFE